jgi:hypothetical protein
MKKITKRLSLRREVLQHLDLRSVAGGTITTPTKPDASCSNCTVIACNSVNCPTNGCTINPSNNGC